MTRLVYPVGGDVVKCELEVSIMGGTNPYIEKPRVVPPQNTYKVTFINRDKPVEVDPTKIPYGPTGQPGSILDIALGAGVDLEHVCGGGCAGSTCHVLVKEGRGWGGVGARPTCHVIVKEGLVSCNEATDDEMDQIDEAPATTLQSRLGCQCVPNGTMDVVVEIPDWNKNLVKEGH